MASTTQPVFQLKITLAGIRPPIWRRVQVPGTVTLGRLHQVIQEAFGWWGYHLHEFEIDGVRYGSDLEDDWDPPRDESRVRLRTVVGQGGRFLYTYDFGDNWEHRIEVEDIVPAERGVTYPRCTAARRCRPPEDVGGTWGYAEFLEAITDPAHEEHDQMLDWCGGDFDPEECDLASINASLTPLHRA